MVYCRRYVSIIEDRISSYLYNELFCKINDKKWRAFKNMACSLIVYKNTIRNCSTALQAFLFRSISLYPFFSFFIKARILLQFLSQAFSIFLMFSPIFFRFHKCFNNFHLSKNILINEFFSLRHVFLRVFVFPGPWSFAWPPALAPNSYLPALAPDFYIPALASNLCLPALAANLYLLALSSNLLFTSSGQDFTTTNTATCTITTSTITTTTTTTTTTTATTTRDNNNKRCLRGSKIRIEWPLKDIWRKSQVLIQYIVSVMANVSPNREAAAFKEIGIWLFLKQIRIIAESIKMNKSRVSRDTFCGGL